MGEDTRSISFDEKMILKKFDSGENLLGIPDVYLDIILNLGINNRDFDFAGAIAADNTMSQNLVKLAHLHLSDQRVKSGIHTIDDAAEKLDNLTFKTYLIAAIMEKPYCDYDKFEWQHAFSCSLLLAELVKNGCIEISERFIAAAFLHDVGKLVFNKVLPKKYQMLKFQTERGAQSYFEGENTMFKINHSQTGAMLLKQWQVSPMVYVAVRSHHNESFSERYPTESMLLQLIDLTDRTARGYEVTPPSKELLEAQGWGDFNLADWVEFQEKIIAQANLSSPPPKNAKEDAAAPEQP